MHASVVTVYIKSEHREEFMAAAKTHAAHVLAHAPGCIRFDVLQSEDDPDVFYYYEAFRDAETMAAHLQLDESQEYRKRVDVWRARPSEGHRGLVILPRQTSTLANFRPEDTMHAIVVSIQIKPEFADQFAEAAREHAEHSTQEPGCLRFDVVRFKEDPTRFMYLEVWENEEVSRVHAQSARTQTYRETTGPWRAQTNVPQAVTVIAPAALA